MTETTSVAQAESLSTRDWLDAAKSLLLREGIDAVKIERIAKECGVTRGGFYWRFKGRAELLDALLDEWKQANTNPLLEVLSGPGTPAERFAAAASLWIEEEEFDPRFDTAVRNWASVSPEVAEVVREVDDTRIEGFRKIFSEMGFGYDQALVRARITYFHQIGYYTLHMEEDKIERLRLSKIYYHVLTGLPEFAG